MQSPNKTDEQNMTEQTPLLPVNATGSTGPGRSLASSLTEFLSWPSSSKANVNGSVERPGGSSSPPLASSHSTEFDSLSSGDTDGDVNGDGNGNAGKNDSNGKQPEQPPQGRSGSVSSPGPSPDPISRNPSWGKPAGLEPRKANDQNLLIFRRAIGISIDTHTADTADPEAASSPSLEESRKLGTGIYGRIMKEKRSKTLQYNILSSFVNTCHVVQIVVGAALTTLGPSAAKHTTAITVLGASNTVLAGVFALLKGQGLPDRLHRDAVEFRRVQDWIEETDALLALGVVGRDRKEVGQLVETAFKKYNAVLASEENNKPESYVRQQPEGPQSHGQPEQNGQNQLGAGGGTMPSDRASSDSDRAGNSMVRLNFPALT